MIAVLRLVDAFTETVGRWVSWLVLPMMGITCLVVLLRYGFGVGSIALQESIMYLHGILFMLAIPWTLKQDGHVRVDVLYARLAPVRRDVVDLAGHLLFLLPLAGFILWMSLDYVARAWAVREGSSEVGGIEAVFLLKTLIPVLGGLLVLQGLAEVLRIALRLAGRLPREAAGDAGPAGT